MQNQIGEGNHERAWNDPPQLSFESTANPFRQKKDLRKMKRPSGPSLPQTSVPSNKGDSVAAPPICPPKTQETSAEAKECPNSNVSVEEKFDVIAQSLQSCLSSVNDAVDEGTAEDIHQRIEKFKGAWQGGFLNEQVQNRMYELAQALDVKDYGKAWTVHQSIIVDYTSLCVSWMSGVKALISAVRKS